LSRDERRELFGWHFRRNHHDQVIVLPCDGRKLTDPLVVRTVVKRRLVRNAAWSYEEVQHLTAFHAKAHERDRLLARDAFDLRLLSLGITLFVADLDFRRARHRLPADQTGLTSGWADSRHFPRGYPPTAMSVTVSATESAFLRRIVGNLTHGKRISAVEFAQRACDHLAQHHGYSLGTSDLLAWLRRGEQPTRERAGDLLRRVRERIAEPPRRRRFDQAAARKLEEQLCRIRFGRADDWPSPLAVFRAARRLL